MITANELRRRNLVYRASDKSIEVVNTIFCNSVCLQGCNDNFYCQEIEPIPLTPEILEKAGFVEIKDEGRGIGVFVNGVYDFEETILGSGDYALAIHQEYTMTKIRYVHQLQNLYYSLTGNELDIKI